MLRIRTTYNSSSFTADEIEQIFHNAVTASPINTVLNEQVSANSIQMTKSNDTFITIAQYENSTDADKIWSNHNTDIENLRQHIASFGITIRKEYLNN